jgi:hypothetical protein
MSGPSMAPADLGRTVSGSAPVIRFLNCIAISVCVLHCSIVTGLIFLLVWQHVSLGLGGEATAVNKHSQQSSSTLLSATTPLTAAAVTDSIPTQSPFNASTAVALDGQLQRSPSFANSVLLEVPVLHN